MSSDKLNSSHLSAEDFGYKGAIEKALNHMSPMEAYNEALQFEHKSLFKMSDKRRVELEDFVLYSPKCSYEFALNIKNADIKKLQRGVLKSSKYAYLFARNIGGADIATLEDIIALSPEWSYEAAIGCVPTIDRYRMQEAFAESAHYVGKYIYEQNRSEEKINELKQAFPANIIHSSEQKYEKEKVKNDTPATEVEISQSVRDAYTEAKDKGYSKELERLVLDHPRVSFLFAKNIKGADRERLQEAVLISPEWAYSFAKHIPGADIEKLQDAVLENPYQAYNFAKNIKGADIPKLEKYMGKYLSKFNNEVIKDIIE